MVTIKPKTFVTLSADAECVSHSRTDISVRDTRITVDEPFERNGTNMGPSPTETMLASLCACTNVITQKLCHKHEVEVDSMHVKVEADFNRKGVMLQEEIDVPFRAVRIYIDLKSSSPAVNIDKVKEDLPKFCPVSKVISQSGSKVEEIWTVTAP